MGHCIVRVECVNGEQQKSPVGSGKGPIRPAALQLRIKLKCILGPAFSGSVRHDDLQPQSVRLDEHLT